MFITIRISLQLNTTEKHAEELGKYIAQHIKDSVSPRIGEPIDKVYLSVDQGDGNYLGP